LILVFSCLSSASFLFDWPMRHFCDSIISTVFNFSCLRLSLSIEYSWWI
jgi:hypothetical protein